MKAAVRTIWPAFTTLRAGASRSPWTCPGALTRRCHSGQAIPYAYSAEEDAAIIQARARGIPYKKIGMALGRTSESVRLRYRDYLRQERPRRKPWIPSEDALILKKRAAGATWTEIAAELGRPRTTVNLRYLLKLLPSARDSPQSTVTSLNSVPKSSARTMVDETILQTLKRDATVAKQSGISADAVSYRYSKLSPQAWAARCATNKGRRQKPFTSEENAEILRLMQSGVARGTIARHFGRSNRQIYDHISAHPLFTNAKASIRKFNKAEIEQMLKLHAHGYTRLQISQALGRQHAVVSRKLNEILGNQAGMPMNREWDGKDAKLATELCAQGCTIRQIALRLRRSHGSVKSYLTKAAEQVNVGTPAARLHWSEEEKQKLARLYNQNLSWETIVSQFPSRTRASVQSCFYNRLVDRANELPKAPLPA